MRIKICGITQPEQGKEIVALGATALGFICVPGTPRYVNLDQIQAVVEQVPAKTDLIGVFVNASWEEIRQTVTEVRLTGVQLHGDESPEFCRHLRQSLPNTEIIKALRVQNIQLLQANVYNGWVSAMLIDAYHPSQMGGTGKTLDWTTLRHYQPSCPWFLSGGLKPDNILEALKQVHPDGIDLSSGVERAPGDKDLTKVAQLFEQLSLAPKRKMVGDESG